ncbi:RRNAD1 [Bugula neritina]|uniref:rRNAD1 n=1 Tax=Bugula neritina TaxID=10212 RepID=A0A7J7IVJ7_BUGNE|nr:RRNAD1 [Bugula neritina]
MALPSLTCQSVCTLKKQLRTIDGFLCNYDWLMNSYTTDYFTLDLEKKFPSSFSEFLLKDGSLNDLASLLPDWQSDSSQGDDAKAAETTPVSGAVLPLSMIAFRSLCRSLSLNQKLGVVADESLGATVFGGSLEKYFRVCVKAKKKHEVDLLAEMLSILCKSQGCERVVDIGAGLGHLSRLLSYNKNLKVTTVEATDSHSPKAQRLDR